jgi:hypothetical protein
MKIEPHLSRKSSSTDPCHQSNGSTVSFLLELSSLQNLDDRLNQPSRLKTGGCTL